MGGTTSASNQFFESEGNSSSSCGIGCRRPQYSSNVASFDDACKIIGRERERRRRRCCPSIVGGRTAAVVVIIAATIAGMTVAAVATTATSTVAGRALKCSRIRHAGFLPTFRALGTSPSSSSSLRASNIDSSYDRTPPLPPPQSFVLAPMVAQSDLAFRLMCEHRHGVNLSYTQMIHATNFVDSNGDAFRRDHLDVYPRGSVTDALLRGEVAGEEVFVATPSQHRALEGLTEKDVADARSRIVSAMGDGGTFEPKPTVVQIAAHNPDVALKAALMIIERSGTAASDIPTVAAIDLNLGCPQGIARKGKYGAFLHDEDPEAAYSVLSRLREGLPSNVGVTAKVRLPPSREDADAGKLGNLSSLSGDEKYPPSPEMRMQRLIDCGVDWITVHGRTRFENKNAVEAADWTAVKRCVDAARDYSGNERYPVFANGGIEFPGDVERCLEDTGATGVMSSEGLLEDPGLFGRVGGGSTDVDGIECVAPRDLIDRQLQYADTYLDYATVFPPLPGSLGAKGGSFNVIRSHLFKYLFRYLEENPDLRSALGDQATTSVRAARDIIAELRVRYANVGDEEMGGRRSSGLGGSWYRRHRRREGLAARGGMADADDTTTPPSVEERKRIAKERILKMREERKKRELEAQVAA